MENGITLETLIIILGILLFIGLNMFLYLDNGFNLSPKNGVTPTPNQITFRLVVLIIDCIMVLVLLSYLIVWVTRNWNMVILT